MPRLPTKSDDPLVAPGVAPLAFPDTGAQLIGKAVAGLGGDIVQIADATQKKEDALDLAKWEAARRPQYEGVVDRFHSDNDYATFEPRAKAALSTIDKEALPIIRNPALREQARYKATIESDGALRRILTHGQNLRKQDAEVTFDNSLTGILSGITPNSSPDDAAEVLRHARANYDNMNSTGAVEPGPAKRIWDKNVSGINSTLYRAANSRLWSGRQAAYDTLRDLGTLSTSPDGSSNVDVTPSQIKDYTAPSRGKRSGPVEYVALHHSSGRTLAGALEEGVKRGTGATYYQDRDGQWYQWAPEDQKMITVRDPGSRYRNGNFPGLTNDNTISIERIALNHNDLTEAQKRTFEPFMDALLKRNPSIKRGNVVGHGEIQGGPGGNKEADEGSEARDYRAGASVERGTLPDIGVEPKTAQSGATTTDANDRFPEITGEKSGWAKVYEQLSPQARAHLATNARTALHAILQEEVKRAAIVAGNTGELPKDENGQTVKDHMKGVLTPNQIAKYGFFLDAAINRHKATTGIEDMSPDEAAKHFHETLDPERQEKEDQVPLEIAEKNRVYAARRYEAMHKAGRDDPWQFVTGMQFKDGTASMPSREVANAYHLINGRKPDLGIVVRQDGSVTFAENHDAGDAIKAREQMIEAGLSAQRRLGLPPRVISRREAQQLLPFEDDIKNMTDDDITNVVRQANQVAPMVYGKYGEKALKDAIFLTIKDKHARDTANAAIAVMLRGGIDAQDLLDAVRGNEHWWSRLAGNGLPSPATMERQGFGAQAMTQAATEGSGDELASPFAAGGERAFPGPVSEYSGYQPSSGLSPGNPGVGMLPGISMSLSQAKSSVPSKAQLQWLQKNRDDPHARTAFDSIFSPGAADRYVPRK